MSTRAAGVLAIASILLWSGGLPRVRAQSAQAESELGAGDDDAGVPLAEPPSRTAASVAAPAASPTSEPAPARAPEPAADGGSSYGAVAVAPAPFARTELANVPVNVQRMSAADLDDSAALGLHDALQARLGSAVINDVQNNPLQPDFQFRGYTAGPLLGTPQGVAIYQNGVRVNEAFGDVVQWDLIPLFAVADLELLPGANPLYGLNALGGSLALRMKNGWSAPGYRLSALGGSFGRYVLRAEAGRAWDAWGVYAGLSRFGERGFRDHSPSRATNLFADVRRRDSAQEIGLSFSLGVTDLRGNGPVPVELIERRRAEVFTWPDITRNDAFLVSLDGRKQLAEHVSLQALAYLRHGERATINGDEAELEPCTPDGAAEPVLCDEAGDALRDEAGRSVAAGERYDGLFNTTDTRSDGGGGSLLVYSDARLGSHGNLLLAGASADVARVAFLQRAELGFLTLDRTVQGSALFLSNDAFRTALESDNAQLGVYVSDTLQLGAGFAVTAAARFNWARLQLDDRDGRALDGTHVFTRLNPALGLTYTPARALTFFASYGESNRTPSASELACADPDQPCRLPNAFLADPPLEQVVSRSLEIGVRGRLGERRGPRLWGSLAAFGARNSDDILFVAGSRVGTGYFRNAGETQRLGIELALNGVAGPVRWYFAYSWLEATFESELELPGGAHPAAEGGGSDGDDGDDDEGGVLEVEPGDRIPGLPKHSVKAGASVEPLSGLRIGLALLAQSSQPLRGDEPNLLDALPGHAVLNLSASYQLFEPLRLVAVAHNLFDAEYETFGLVADPSTVLPDADDPRFVSPGAPFGIWVGAVLAID